MYQLDVQKVKKIMLNKGISTAQLSTMLKVSRVSVYRYLKTGRKMHIRTINNISRELEVEPSSIVKEKRWKKNI